MADERNKLSLLTGSGDGNPPPPPPPATASAGGAGGGKDELTRLVMAMVATGQRLPNFELIKAEIAADRREVEVAEKTELLKLRNGILEDVRPFIDLMKKERPEESEY